MPAETTNLFLVEDLEDISRTSKLADSDLDSLRIVADWINTFITQPHKELAASGRCVPSCQGRWNVRRCGSLRSTSPIRAGLTLSSS
jgi:hypothetical protein